ERMHPWFLETSPLARMYKGTPEQFTEDIVKPFWEIHDRNLAQYLKPHEGVNKSLTRAHAQDTEVVALTNAPLPLAVARTRAAGLDGKIDHLYGVEVTEPSLNEVVSPSALENGRRMVNEIMSNPGKLRSTTAIPADFKKPDVRGLETVLGDLSVRPAQVLAV